MEPMEEILVKHNGSFSIVKWEEENTEQLPAPMKLSLGHVERMHKGVLDGKETMRYSFVYSRDDRSEFVGIGIFEGSLAGTIGCFAVIEQGSYIEGKVHTKFDIRELSETSDLGKSLGIGEYTTSEHVDVSYVFLIGS